MTITQTFMQLSSRDMKPIWKHSVFKIFCYNSKFMTSENLIRLFPFFRSRRTSPVIKMHVGWLTRAGWPNFWASYQNIQRVEHYQLPICQRAVGREDPGVRTLQRSHTLPTCSRLSMQLVPEVTRDIGQSCSPWPPSLPAGQVNYPVALVLHLHSLQTHIAWIKVLLHPMVWTTITSSGYLIQQVMRAQELLAAGLHWIIQL